MILAPTRTSALPPRSLISRCRSRFIHARKAINPAVRSIAPPPKNVIARKSGFAMLPPAVSIATARTRHTMTAYHETRVAGF